MSRANSLMVRTLRHRSNAWSQAAVIVALLLIVLWRWQAGFNPVAPPAREQQEILPEGFYAVDHVVDGDTVKLTNGQRVRLLGVDTPESVKPDTPVEPWGPEASAFTKRFLASGQARLEFDREKHDDYGRLLAYVYAINPATGREELLNEELLRAGMGHALLRHPYSAAMKRRFREAQQSARDAKRGIWSGGR
ncbi:MAG: thermonuclease family protein [Pirellulales bacterium]|nr:thermonuclease family protein [Pirellulales bacterium]